MATVVKPSGSTQLNFSYFFSDHFRHMNVRNSHVSFYVVDFLETNYLNKAETVQLYHTTVWEAVLGYF